MIRLNRGVNVGALTVLRDMGPDDPPMPYRSERYVCLCACGAICYPRHCSIVWSHTRSCGCRIHIKRGWEFVKPPEFQPILSAL